MKKLVTIMAVAILVATGPVGATGFINSVGGAAGDGSYDPGYTPSFELRFSGSMWTVDTDGDGLGAEGVFVVGDRNRAGDGWNPALSQRAFNVFAANGQPDGDSGAPIVNHDPFPSWTPNTPDADPGWVAAYSGNERYGMEMAVGAGVYALGAIYANDGDTDSNSAITAGVEWGVGLWPWVNNATRSAQVLPYSGTIGSFVPVFTDLGALDRLDVTGTLIETDGYWNTDWNTGTPAMDEEFALADTVFDFTSTMFETGNSFTIPNPLGAGTWTVNEWAGETVVSTPEPATMSLLALGGLAVLRRRRRRNA